MLDELTYAQFKEYLVCNPLKGKLISELIQSIKEAGLIEKGELQPAHVSVIDALDIAAIRNRTHKTQEEFAAMLNISIGTLRNWEQGRRKPDGAALSLLKVVSANPQYVESVLMT